MECLICQYAGREWADSMLKDADPSPAAVDTAWVETAAREAFKHLPEGQTFDWEGESDMYKRHEQNFVSAVILRVEAHHKFSEALAGIGDQHGR